MGTGLAAGAHNNKGSDAMGGLEGSFVFSARSALVVLGLAASALLAGCGSEAGAQSGPPPAAPVSVAPAVQRTVLDSEEFSGRLEATEFVELRPRVAGTIDKVHFSDGTLVARGQLLYSIDPLPFQAEVARAQAQVTAARSRAALAASEVARAQGLLEAKAVSRQEFDQLASSQRTTESDIRAAEAALQVARLNLGHASVRAPIAGRISRANVTAGNVVGEQTVLTTIAGSGPIYAYFDGSEQTYLRLRSSGDKTPKVRMGLANEQGFPHEGRVDFVDNRLNPQTGAIRLRARFANERGDFTPGLGARMVLTTSAPYSAVMVPERAIGTDQTKKIVFVVGSDAKPQPREVKLGALFGGMRVVLDGVKSGEHVVVDGLQRIIPGLPVAPQLLAVDASGMPIVPPPAPPGAPPKGEGGAPAAKKTGTT
jgi:multidrug efflux system membrane fusion protein